MPAEALAQVLRPLRELAAGRESEDLLVGLEIADDAAVYRINDDQAIVVTLDFFTPIVDDPYSYGAIAAANSLSDVYAMGGVPILALNVAGMPSDLPLETVSEIFRGGAEKALEANILVAGGHSVRDQEPKYGLVVVGTIHPDQLKTKGGAAAGNRLFLSKALGTGVITTALMKDRAEPDEVAAATESMLALNREAAELAHEFGATALTDVTGFGLLGHLAEMERNGDVGFDLSFGALPWLPGSERLGEAGSFPGGAHDNQKHFSDVVRFEAQLEPWQRTLCFGPETSGGLLMTVPEAMASRVERESSARGIRLWPIGSTVPAPGIRVGA